MLLVAGLAPTWAMAEAPAIGAEASPPADLASLSIEQLMDVEVTSVSKRPQRLGNAAAAVYVITQEDIRRSGMTSVPELLRMVPGLNVAQADSRHWAISSRGFNGIYSTKLLVLVDGRAVYSSTFAGVYWDVQDMPLEDIERIEVIRGPGGTLWGANAVDGVINIITKSAEDTQGLQVSAGGGTEAPGIGMARYGGKLSNHAYFRIYAKGFKRNSFDTLAGPSANDSWSQGQVGVRVDWTPSSDDKVMAQAEYYGQTTNGDFLLPNLALPPGTVTPVVEHDNGGHVLFDWRHRFSDTSDFSLQAYYDRAASSEFTYKTDVDTYDVELRRRFVAGRHDIVLGAGYRLVNYTAEVNHPYLAITPSHQQLETYNGFAQDEIALTDALHLIAGAKVEHTSFTGFEFEPNVRLSWRVSADHTVWAAVSRAVRTPAVIEERIRFDIEADPGPPPLVVSAFGNPGQKSEQEVSWEAGYRSMLAPGLSLDAAVFYSRYRDLASAELGTPFVAPTPLFHLVLPVFYGNVLRGETYGGEIAANWQATSRWRIMASYTRLNVKLKSDSPFLAPQAQPNSAGSSAQNQFQIHSFLSLPWRTELDAALYHADGIKDGNVPAYTRVDLRLGWRPTDRIELSLVGQNLLDPRHPEAGPPFFRAPTEVPRSVFLKAAFGL